MKNILILTNGFPPEFNPRVAYLAKYISKYGYQATVIALKVEDKNSDFHFSHFDGFDGNGITVKRVSPLNIRYSALDKTKYLFHAGFTAVPGLVEAIVISAQNEIARTKQNFDIIFVSGSLSFMAAAQFLAQQWKIPFVVDVRDVDEQSVQVGEHLITQLRYYRNLFCRNQYFRHADAVTTVSRWHGKYLSQFNKKSKVIYNGFDSEIFFPTHPKKHNSVFSIVYTGRVWGVTQRNPSLLFAALQRLQSEKFITTDDVSVQFYSPASQCKDVLEVAAQYQVSNMVKIQECIDNNLIPAVLNQADMLLVLGNRGTHGVMTTKFFEYLATQRPILFVRSDEEELEAFFHKYKCGCAGRSVNMVYDYVKEKIDEWRDLGYTQDQIFTDLNPLMYSRQKQAGDFAMVFNQLLDKESYVL